MTIQEALQQREPAFQWFNAFLDEWTEEDEGYVEAWEAAFNLCAETHTRYQQLAGIQ
jgi:hypothetical protein